MPPSICPSIITRLCHGGACHGWVGRLRIQSRGTPRMVEDGYLLDSLAVDLMSVDLVGTIFSLTQTF